MLDIIVFQFWNMDINVLRIREMLWNKFYIRNTILYCQKFLLYIFFYNTNDSLLTILIMSLFTLCALSLAYTFISFCLEVVGSYFDRSNKVKYRSLDPDARNRPFWKRMKRLQNVSTKYKSTECILLYCCKKK